MKEKTKEQPGKPNLRKLEQIASFLDSKYMIPGTRFRFGLDPILGLIPGVGDAVTFGISGLLVYYMSRHGVSNKVVIKMTLNVILDTIIGSIPVIGQIFDFYYKANDKNIRLLKEHYHEGRHQGSGKGIIIVVILGFLVLTGLVIWGIIELFEWIIGLL